MFIFEVPVATRVILLRVVFEPTFQESLSGWVLLERIEDLDVISIFFSRVLLLGHYWDLLGCCVRPRSRPLLGSDDFVVGALFSCCFLFPFDTCLQILLVLLGHDEGL